MPRVWPNPGQAEISNVFFKDFDVVLEQDKLAAGGVKDVRFENVDCERAAAVDLRSFMVC